MILRGAAFVATVALVGTSALAAPVEKHYCFSEDVTANGDEPLGTFYAELTVKTAGTATLMSYESVMPDTQQELSFDDAKAVGDKSGAYAIKFTDNWDNKGSARVTVKGNTASIKFGDITPSEDGANAMRGYDDSTMTVAGCRHKKPKS